MLRLQACCLGLVCAVASALRADEFRFSTDIGLRPIGQVESAKSFSWEANATSAFKKSIKRNLPMVMVFTNAGNVNNTNFLVELGADGLKEFADKAVFVHVLIPLKISGPHDQEGLVVAQQLELTIVPTISVFPPNNYSLIETQRMEGYVSHDQIKQGLAKGLSTAMTSDLTWNPSTPADLVRHLDDAFKNGIGLKYAACYADPAQSVLLKLAQTQSSVGRARQRFLETMDAKFGKQADRMSYLDDEDQMHADLSQIRRLELLAEFQKDGERQVSLRFTHENQAGVSSQFDEEFCVTFERGGWRLRPSDNNAFAGRIEQRLAGLKFVASDLEQLAERVNRGEFADARSALELAAHMYTMRRDEAVTVQK